jgi:hypothetical protein
MKRFKRIYVETIPFCQESIVFVNIYRDDAGFKAVAEFPYDRSKETVTVSNQYLEQVYARLAEQGVI